MRKNRKAKKRGGIVWPVIIMLAIFVAATWHYQQNYCGQWQFGYAEDKEMTSNPYQGAYVQIYTGYWEEIYEIRDQYPDCNMILLVYNLDDERTLETIPEKKINDLHKSLQAAEEEHFSVIFRSAYDFIGEYQDPDFNIILGHIEQISEVLNQYKDCIAGVQAGMIGPFGEWTQSKYMEERHYRIQVLEKWLEHLEPEIPVAVRRSKFIRDAQEYGVDTSRVGVHNDGLFASESDLGTYRENYTREEDLLWSEENIKVPFNGGEMPFVSEFADVSNVVKEAGQLQLSYLNQEYNGDVWRLWESQQYDGMPGDEYIKKHLGIRLWADGLNIDKNFYKRKKFFAEILLNNAGFATISEDYVAFLILKYNDHIIKTEAELTMDSKEDGRILGEIENPYFLEKPEDVLFGVQISRGEPNSDGIYDLRLTNQNIEYESGYNWIYAYHNEEE